jgi:hypothetical protein
MGITGAPGLSVDGPDDQDVTIPIQRRGQRLPRRVGIGEVRGRQRDLRSEDVRGRGHDRSPAAPRQLAREAEHRR